MDLKEKILSLQNHQKQMIDECEEILKAYNADSLIDENTKLRKIVEESEKELKKLRRDLEKIAQENDSLKLSLKEQILSEKLNILKVSREKLNDLFGRFEEQYHDRLTEIEWRTKSQLSNLQTRSLKNLSQKQDEFFKKINELKIELDQAVQEEAAIYQKNIIEFKDESSQEFEQLTNTEVSPELIQKRIKGNQWEMKIGLNLINKIGMLLILLGVGAAFKYSFDNWMDNYLKGICFFLLGGLFLVGGEWFYRRQKQIFALGLLGGGIAILYGSVFYSYFVLQPAIINLEVALLLSILVTLTSIVLSLRYNSQIIAAFGLVGGFLPFISYASSFGITGNAYFAVMGYLFILNMVLLVISFQRRWNVIQYISFLFNTPAMIFLVFNIPWIGWGIGYAGLTFLMYLVVSLSYPFKHQEKINFVDIVLLGLNTVVNCLVLFLLLIKAGLTEYRGLLALFFCLAYFGLGQFITKKMAKEKTAGILFYTTALSFAILIIPFQFGIQWLSLGWLVEALLLIIVGSRQQQKALEYSGWGIFGLCIYCFGDFEFIPHIIHHDKVAYFDFKYASVTMGQLIILSHYLWLIWKKQIIPTTNLAGIIYVHKYFTIFSVWVYSLITVNQLYNRWIPAACQEEAYPILLSALLTFLLGYLIIKIPIVYDQSIKALAFFFYVIADLLCLIVTLYHPALKSGLWHSTGQEYVVLAIIVFFNIFALFNIKDLILAAVKKNSHHLEMYPLLCGLLLLGDITALLIVQFRLGGVNLLFSFVYLVSAIGFIIYGFQRKYVYIRRFGLGLTFFAVAKLFLYDLSFLRDLGKIIAYFGFGFVLLAISLIYQRIKSNVEGNNVTKEL